MEKETNQPTWNLYTFPNLHHASIQVREAKASDMHQLAGLFYHHQDLNLLYRCFSRLRTLTEGNWAGTSPVSMRQDAMLVATQVRSGRQEILALGCFFNHRKQKLAELVYISQCKGQDPELEEAVLKNLVQKAIELGVEGFYLKCNERHRQWLPFIKGLKLSVRQSLHQGLETIEILFPQPSPTKKRGLRWWLKRLGKAS